MSHFCHHLYRMDHQVTTSDSRPPSLNFSVIERPIFIVGAGRSGTTLLRSLLSAHSRISIAPETHFMKTADVDSGLDRGAPRDFEAFWRSYSTSIRFIDLGVDPEHCRELIERQGKPTYRTIFSTMLVAYGETLGKVRIGEKTPGNIHVLSYLLEWFPEARVIILGRDPRAMVASQLHTPWIQNRLTPLSLRQGLLAGKRLHAVASQANGWARIYEKMVPQWQGDSRVLTVSYEALVQDVEDGMRAICDFLEEPYEPSMLTGRTQETVPSPAAMAEIHEDPWREWRREHHAQTLRPISTDSVEKWKKELTKIEVGMIEGRCARGMRVAGYAPSTSPLQRSLGGVFSRMVATMGGLEAGARDRAKRVFGPVPRFGRHSQEDYRPNPAPIDSEPEHDSNS